MNATAIITNPARMGWSFPRADSFGHGEITNPSLAEARAKAKKQWCGQIITMGGTQWQAQSLRGQWLVFWPAYALRARETNRLGVVGVPTGNRNLSLDSFVSSRMERYQESDGPIADVEIHADTPKGRAMYTKRF